MVLIGRGHDLGGGYLVCSLCDESLSFTADGMYVVYDTLKHCFPVIEEAA